MENLFLSKYFYLFSKITTSRLEIVRNISSFFHIHINLGASVSTLSVYIHDVPWTAKNYAM